MRLSVAMAGSAESELATHLLRQDGQEDLCFATWRPSTGHDRTTALIDQALLPGLAERQVHGNASFLPQYALRAAEEAGQRGNGLAFMHSHPLGSGWQALNDTDAQAEARIANDGLAAKQIDAPQAAGRVSDERQPRGPTSPW